jgi:hypothetical protein
MCLDASFYEQLQSHVGGMVRVVRGVRQHPNFEELVGEIGILLSIDGRWRNSLLGLVRINMFIGGSIRALDLERDEIELIGANDAS